ncbi:DUF6082 family protein [Actinoplanes sp. CA-054009]
MRLRTPVSAVVMVLTGTAVAVALASPLVLTVVGEWWNVDWSRMADIGQAYGAASAIFSALAVAGVAASLVYQARQFRIMRRQAVRTMQRETLFRALDDPALLRVVYPDPLPAGEPDQRERLFARLWFHYLHTGYEGGSVTGAAARDVVMPKLMRSEAVRAYWKDERHLWLEASREPTERSFGRIVDDVYMRHATPPPTTPTHAETPPDPTPPPPPIPTAVHLAGAVLTGAAVGWFLSRRR